MASYFVRVEIYDASFEQYEALHEAMGSLGMYKFLVDRSFFDAKALPDGCYFGSPAISTAGLRDTVLTISRLYSSKEPSVFVAQLSDWEFNLHNLGDPNYP